MQQTIQSLSALERRVDLTVPAAAIEQEVKTRLVKLARGMKMPGFRPGKVPIKMVEQTYGAQVQAEVLNDKVGEAFNSAVTASNLKVAGQPRLEARESPIAITSDRGERLGRFQQLSRFIQTSGGDFTAEVQRATCRGEAEIVASCHMRKQRATFRTCISRIRMRSGTSHFKGTYARVSAGQHV